MRAALALAAAAAALALSLPANAVLTVYTAPLSGPAESPPNASPGIGFARVIVDTAALTMHVESSFAGLTGTTMAAHIHCCVTVPGGAAGVATTTPSFVGFPLGVTSGTFDNTLSLTAASSFNPAFVTANGGTPASATAVLLAGLDAGTTYFNIHTTTFPGGEIRGFLTPVAAIPEPETYLLLLAGLGLIGSLAKRRRRRS